MGAEKIKKHTPYIHFFVVQVYADNVKKTTKTSCFLL